MATMTTSTLTGRVMACPPGLCFSNEAVTRASRRPSQTTAVSGFPVRLARPGQEAVELVGEALAVAGAEGRRATDDLAGGAKLLQQIAHGQALADVVLRVKITPRIERVS